MKRVLKALVPSALIRKIQNLLYFAQGNAIVSYGGVDLLAPKKHILLGLNERELLSRDHCIGIAAKFATDGCPDANIVDIGANIGDTAAIISQYCPNDLVLVEASKYFFRYLKSNVARLPNNCQCVNAFIYDGNKTHGTLVHWGGTAYYDSLASSVNAFETLTLDCVSDSKTKLIKIDADGCDHRIILSAAEWLSVSRPAIIFEEQIRDSQDLSEACEVFDCLSGIGYSSFVIWDQSGKHLMSTEVVEDVRNKCRELFRVWDSEGERGLYNYEILCLSPDDNRIFSSINDYILRSDK